MALITLQVVVLDHPEESPVDTVAQTRILYLEKLVGNVISVDPETFVPVKLPHCNRIPLLKELTTNYNKITINISSLIICTLTG